MSSELKCILVFPDLAKFYAQEFQRRKKLDRFKLPLLAGFKIIVRNYLFRSILTVLIRHRGYKVDLKVLLNHLI